MHEHSYNSFMTFYCINQCWSDYGLLDDMSITIIVEVVEVVVHMSV